MKQGDGSMIDLSCKVIPDLYAEIEPNIGAANIRLGLNFSYFIKNIDYINVTDNDVTVRNIALDIPYENYDTSMKENKIIKTKNIWCIYHKDPWEWNGDLIDNIYAYWNNSVILEFNKKKIGDYILSSICLQNEYKGKYMNILGVGDKMSLLLDAYDILFHGDLHYLAKKIITDKFDDLYCSNDFELDSINNLSWENRELIRGMNIQTNYREAVDQNNFTRQIAESIEVFIDT